MLEIDSLMKNNISISTTERDSIMEAKQIIDAQLICAPSCSELAKQVRMSVSKLTKGFSNTVGIPIHTYIIEQRLIRGAQLLLEGNLNVSEVATIVGYTKPSNFSAAFKKKYGVTPKEYKIQCFTYTEVLEANYNYEKNLKMFYSAEMAVLYRGTIVLIYPLINYFLS